MHRYNYIVIKGFWKEIVFLLNTIYLFMFIQIIRKHKKKKKKGYITDMRIYRKCNIDKKNTE